MLLKEIHFIICHIASLDILKSRNEHQLFLLVTSQCQINKILPIFGSIIIMIKRVSPKELDYSVKKKQPNIQNKKRKFLRLCRVEKKETFSIRARAIKDGLLL